MNTLRQIYTPVELRPASDVLAQAKKVADIKQNPMRHRELEKIIDEIDTQASLGNTFIVRSSLLQTNIKLLTEAGYIVIKDSPELYTIRWHDRVLVDYDKIENVT